jgi:hypothetical protein
MRDNSRRNVYQTGLPAGRIPSRLATVPYRIEEWSKGQRVRPPEWWPEAMAVMKTGKPYFLRDGQDPQGIALRGRPGLGILTIYIGEETKLPSKGRVVEVGLALNAKDARDRLDAFIRRRQLAQMDKARRRAGVVSTGGRPPVS